MKTVLSLIMLFVFSLFVSSASMSSKIQIAKEDSTTITLNQKLNVTVSNGNIETLISAIRYNSERDSMLISSVSKLSNSVANYIDNQQMKDATFVKLEEMYSLPRDSIKQAIVKHNYNTILSGIFILIIGIIIYALFFFRKEKPLNSMLAWSVVYLFLSYWTIKLGPSVLDCINNEYYLYINKILLFSG